MNRPVWNFVRHYLEMVAAMLVGMAVLYPLWLVAVATVLDGAAWTGTVEVESVVMATTMAVPMAAWMRWRGHAWAPTVEMSAAMYVGFVVLWPFAWADVLAGSDVVMLGHVLMLVAMLAVMLLRRGEYGAGCGRDEVVAQSQPASRAAR